MLTLRLLACELGCDFIRALIYICALAARNAAATALLVPEGRDFHNRVVGRR
jgi:hypothetical protein